MNAAQTPARKFRKELASGLTGLVVLAALARAGREMYGYEIAKELAGPGGSEALFKQGAVYPVLRSLHAAGFLDSRVEPSVSGPPRRYYALNAEGRRTLDDWRAAWGDAREFVDSILEGEAAHDR
jgi:PadR family transcriptional regulator PadR